MVYEITQSAAAIARRRYVSFIVACILCTSKIVSHLMHDIIDGDGSVDIPGIVDIMVEMMALDSTNHMVRAQNHGTISTS